MEIIIDIDAKYLIYMKLNTKLIPDIDNLKGEVIYNNGSGSTSGNYTKPISDYLKIKVYGWTADNHRFCEEYYPNGTNTIYLSIFKGSHVGSTFWAKSGRIAMNNTSFSIDRTGDLALKSGSITWTEITSALKIHKIIGYKNID